MTTLLHSFGLSRGPLSLQSALMRHIRRGFDVNTVIDVGAFSWIWSLKAMELPTISDFPLIEAQKNYDSALTKL